MRPSISKENILKSSILFFTISAFILSALVFTSCSDSEGEVITDDTALIEKIESAAKVTVEASTLPAATSSVLNEDLADTYIEKVQLAEGLGFKVAVVSDDVTFQEAASDVFFTTAGKQLADTDEKRRGRSKCFEYVYPIILIMPDDSSITLNSKEDWSLKKDWYEANPDVRVRPEIVFPIDITLEDGTLQTLIDTDELREIQNSCRQGRDKRKCFELLLPLSFTMEDGSIIEVATRADYGLLRQWKKDNPNTRVKPQLNYPVDVEFRDGTIVTVEDLAGFIAARNTCN